MVKFDYEGALAEGYTEEEISDYLNSKKKKLIPKSENKGFLSSLKNNASNFYNLLTDSDSYLQEKPIKKNTDRIPGFDVEGALAEGYTQEEIDDYLRSKTPERSNLEKSGRIGAQYGLGALQGTPSGLAYEAAVATLGSEAAQMQAYRETLGEDLERLQQQKLSGQWDEQDEQLYDSIVQQLQDPSLSKEFIQTADLGLKSLAEQATGVDLKAEGALEKAAEWAGFLKDPRKLSAIRSSGLKPSSFIKAISPSGKEALSGVGAGFALQQAEEGDYGPIGTMAAAIVGDVAGRGVAGATKGISGFIKNPKKALAEAAVKMTPNDKKALQKDIIKDFRDSGIQADLGSITDSNLIKWAQSRISQSGLTGKALDEFRDNLTNQIKDEYRSIAEGLGEFRYQTLHEAGEVGREGIKAIRDNELKQIRELYKNADQMITEGSVVNPGKLAQAIDKIEKSLKPGKVKSTEQQAVLNQLEKLKEDIYSPSGKLKMASVKDLMNNKIALGEIINYEVQGGSKQLLKGLVSELDRAIISHGKENVPFVKNYISANKKFSQHAKTFRNKNIEQLLKAADPVSVMNKMNSVQGIRDIGKVLNKTAEGKQIFESMKRLKLEKVIGDHLTDSTTQHVKLGTFSKLLEKGKNRELIGEILGNSSLKRLERLQKNSGKLADSVQKFYNASKTSASTVDIGIVVKAMSDFTNLLAGNPWPLLRTAGGVGVTKSLSKLMADPEFLKIVEDILLSEKSSSKDMIEKFLALRPYLSIYQQES